MEGSVIAENRSGRDGDTSTGPLANPEIRDISGRLVGQFKPDGRARGPGRPGERVFWDSGSTQLGGNGTYSREDAASLERRARRRGETSARAQRRERRERRADAKARRSLA